MKRFLTLAAAAIMAASAFAQPKVVAHRGHWTPQGSAQNSIRAIAKADSIGCWGSEFDVWITRDGSLVVNHDASVGGVDIEKSTARQVTAQRLANGEPVPTLRAYLKKFVQCPNLNLVCELKEHNNKQQEALAVKKIVNMMKQYGLEKRVTYISFSKEATLGFIKYAPAGTEVYYLNGDWTPYQLKEYGCAGLDYSLSTMRNHPEWIDQCHRLGLKVNIWTVNKPADLKWCIDVDADFITTNAPEDLQKMLAK